MARKKGKVTPFRQETKITYNKYKSDRKARRSGIKTEEPPKREEKKPVSRMAVLSESVHRAREAIQLITPPGMTYKEYMMFLKERQYGLQGKTKTINRRQGK